MSPEKGERGDWEHMTQTYSRLGICDSTLPFSDMRSNPTTCLVLMRQNHWQMPALQVPLSHQVLDADHCEYHPGWQMPSCWVLCRLPRCSMQFLAHRKPSVKVPVTSSTSWFLLSPLMATGLAQLQQALRWYGPLTISSQ